MVHKDNTQVKNKNTAIVGFGSRADRFTFTAHPKLDTNGVCHEKPLGCDPVRYHPKDIDEIYKVNKNRSSEPWTCKRELEDWSAHLGYRNQKVLAARKLQATFLGPAWHEVIEPAKPEPVCDNLGFGRTARFRSNTGHCTPAPGTYYRMKPYKAPHGAHTLKPSFEWGPACRFKDTTMSWKPSPCRYKIIDKESIDMKSKKVVSLLGPYELFTVARDLTTIISKNNKSKIVSAKTWPWSLPGCMEKYKKSPYGKFNKTGMTTPYRGRNALIDLTMRISKEGEPGPGEYDVVPRKSFTQCKYAFNISNNKPPGYKRVEVWPAVGRYNIRAKGCGIIGQGHVHVFNSKVQRTNGGFPPEQLNTF